ncbi:divergent polysaccharide deacteylase family protein [Seohaeicola zhoushanensis]|uniref:Divergent polysaccharide deacetylase family protein n=1 Tax=Seohaeicola zhoushanensis TaxID=1569283 RepID=A0A8J3M8G2_9RHOB|nr:divergent polysaccharide deacteylase family protein [Seohaeicola zhoushanensis]GHF59651.1 hypothetical protein GCM10017056_33820 [Seohaeicola zhoushanensis]
MRGFLGGIVAGGVVVGAGLVTLSVLSPVTPVPEVRSEPPVSASGSTSAGESDVGVEGKDAQVVEAKPAAPAEVAAPAAPAAGADTAPADQPEVAPAPAVPGTTAPSAEGAGVEVKPESAVSAPEAVPAPAVPEVVAAPQVAGEAPARPEASAAPEAVSAPSAGGAPVVVTPVEPAPATSDATAPMPQPEGDPAPDVATEAGAQPAPETEAVVAASGATGEAPLPEVAGQSEPAPGGTAPQVSVPGPEAAPEVATAPAAPPVAEPAPAEGQAPASGSAAVAPEAVPAPEVAEVPAQIAAPETRDAPIAVPESDSPPAVNEATPGEAPKVVVLSQAAEGAELQPRIGKRVVPLTERNAAETAEAPVAEVDENAPPLVRFAAPFENPEDKPLMAIVLIDDDKAFGVEALSDFPYPLTFAVDPTKPGAAAKMARHRAAGFEVVALVDLPAAATAQDAEVSLSTLFDRVPEALAVLEGTGTGLQGNRALSDQVSAFAGASGRGVITQGNGLNTMQKLAVKEGVPAAAVFRDFDGAGQSPTVMRRFLDQAAFRAGQEGAVVMLGRVRPDTISSLVLWALQDRATRVALAPVSAVLRASVGE